MRLEGLGFGELFGRIRDAVVVADAETQRIVLWNPAAEEMFGYPAPEALELRVEALVPERLRARHRAGIARYAETGKDRYVASRRPLELPAIRKGGEEICVELSLSPLGPVGGAGRDSGGRFVVAILRDASKRKRLEDKLSHLAYHDSLTGLPNRAWFLERLEEALLRADRARERVALLYLDLDRFKEVNDSFGHGGGDELLKAVAGRLRNGVRLHSCCVARLGGDEFCVLLERVTGAEEVEKIAARLARRLAEPYSVDGVGVASVTASIGVSVRSPGEELPADRFFGEADRAMYRTKKDARLGTARNRGRKGDLLT